MPRVKLDGVLEQLAPELRELHPDLVVDDYALYRAFQRAARAIRSRSPAATSSPDR